MKKKLFDSSSEAPVSHKASKIIFKSSLLFIIPFVLRLDDCIQYVLLKPILGKYLKDFQFTSKSNHLLSQFSPWEFFSWFFLVFFQRIYHFSSWKKIHLLLKSCSYRVYSLLKISTKFAFSCSSVAILNHKLSKKSFKLLSYTAVIIFHVLSLKSFGRK